MQNSLLSKRYFIGENFLKILSTKFQQLEFYAIITDNDIYIITMLL